ncbi:MAG: hypothetical protein NTW54_11995 [Bacteroidetes bacterium]|nr:hypothetical protein [Bacteroidota bacterium]
MLLKKACEGLTMNLPLMLSQSKNNAFENAPFMVILCCNINVFFCFVKNYIYDALSHTFVLGRAEENNKNAIRVHHHRPLIRKAIELEVDYRKIRRIMASKVWAKMKRLKSELESP